MTVDEARAALAARDFRAALDALDDGNGAGTPDWLEVRAHAMYGDGRYEEAVTAWEQLYAHHRTAGENILAARAAVMTAMFLLIDAGLLAAVRGWVRRAQRLLDGEDTVPVHALIEALSGYERFFAGDLDGAEIHVHEAVRLGEHFDVVPAVAIGQTGIARIAVLRGEVADGIAQLEEVAALLMSGEVDDLTTGMMLCELICAAQGLMRPDLAREWTEAMARWSVTGAFADLGGRCRVHQAELLRTSGPCDAAEREALRACEELRPWMRREYGWPLVELGVARLRRGDLSGAEEAFFSAGEHAWPTNPGLALLRLEQGRIDEAVTEIARAIAQPVSAPSKELPPFGNLRLAPLLDGQSEIAYATADRTTAAAAAAGLERTADQYGGVALTATAQLARARSLLLDDQAGAALPLAAAAVASFAGFDAQYDVARCRVVLADVHDALGEPVASRSELVAARDGYTRYGATRRAARIDERLAGAAATRWAPRTTSRVCGELRRDGPIWVVALDGDAARVRDLKGLRYLRRLLAEPGREFHVLDLVAIESGTLRPTGPGSEGLPVLDDHAREAYRRRLADIDDDIDDATRMHDLVRLALAERDREYLINELEHAVGIGGRTRRTGDTCERARTAVARSLRYALDAVETEHAPAAQHLRSSLRTGVYCAYEPDPLAIVTWTL